MGEDNWSPGFIDYLFLAFNTSTAFSPTDVPVLSRWAKVDDDRAVADFAGHRRASRRAGRQYPVNLKIRNLFR